MAQDFRCWLRRAAGVFPGRQGAIAGKKENTRRCLALNRESGASPERARRCDRGRTPQGRHWPPTVQTGDRSRRAARSRIGPCGWEGAASRGIRESEDLPARGVSPVDGERARILWRKGASLDRAKAVQGFFVIGGWPFGGKMERNRLRDCSFVCLKSRPRGPGGAAGNAEGQRCLLERCTSLGWGRVIQTS